MKLNKTVISGWIPRLPWAFYDVSYDRSLFDPTYTFCAGRPGNMMMFDESIDKYTATNVPWM
jgi:hypothetical protein